MATISSGDRLVIAAIGNIGVPLPSQFDLHVSTPPSTTGVLRQYEFILSSGATLIAGKDDSQRKDILRFSATNQVSVFVNGVALDSAAFDRSVLHRILLTDPIEDDDSIVTVVISDVALADTVTLSFKRIDSRDPRPYAWLNTETIQIHDPDIGVGASNFAVFYCDDTSAIKTDSWFTIPADQAFSQPRKWGFLLSNDPHTPYDINPNWRCDIGALIGNKHKITKVVDKQTGSVIITVGDSDIQPIFPPISIHSPLTVSTPLDKVGSSKSLLKPKHIN